jgi:hypothetical protein
VFFVAVLLVFLATLSSSENMHVLADLRSAAVEAVKNDLLRRTYNKQTIGLPYI